MQIEISTANEITYRGDLGSFLMETYFGYNNFKQHDIENIRNLNVNETHIIFIEKQHMTIKRIK